MNRGSDQKTDFFTLTTYNLSNNIMDYQKELIDLSDELFLIIQINKPQTKLIFNLCVYNESIVNQRI